MKEAGTIKFRDVESEDEAVVIVRYDATRVAVCLSLASNGDVEVFMKKEAAKELFDALKQAIG